jgi:hypothetical protein
MMVAPTFSNRHESPLDRPPRGTVAHKKNRAFTQARQSKRFDSNGDVRRLLKYIDSENSRMSKLKSSAKNYMAERQLEL